MIEEYQFGKIRVLNKDYYYDVLINQKGEVFRWQRKESHIIDLEDLEKALKSNPKIVIIGTGELGVAKLTERAKKELEKRGIQLIIDITPKAVKAFNIFAREFKEQKRNQGFVGLFHLTC